MIFITIFLLTSFLLYFLLIYCIHFSTVERNKNSFRYLKNIPCRFMISKNADSLLKELNNETN